MSLHLHRIWRIVFLVCYYRLPHIPSGHVSQYPQRDYDTKTKCCSSRISVKTLIKFGIFRCVIYILSAIVADGLGYTNEVAVDPSGQWLYVNETFGRRLSRFALRADGSLGPKQVVTEFGPGTFPDGLAFDVEGHAWVVSIVSNRLIRVAPDGTPTTWLEDADAEHLARVETAFAAGTMGRPELDGIKSRCLRNISSIAFCGPERRRAVLGCLLGDRLATLPMPTAGFAPTHWNYA